MIQKYKDLTVYTKSYELCIEMYRIAMTLPKEEMYGLTSQIKRASTSIPLNIAEGYGKKASATEFKRYLLMGSGSCNEMLVLLDMSHDLGFINESQHKEYVGRYEEIGKMLGGLLQKWQKF